MCPSFILAWLLIVRVLDSTIGVKAWPVHDVAKLRGQGHDSTLNLGRCCWWETGKQRIRRGRAHWILWPLDLLLTWLRTNLLTNDRRHRYVLPRVLITRATLGV
jgi:hypothetical protein